MKLNLLNIHPSRVFNCDENAFEKENLTTLFIVNAVGSMVPPRKQLITKALGSINLTETIKNGFKVCGLLPFSADAVNYNILNKNKKNIQDGQESNVTNIFNNNQIEYQTHLQFFEKNLYNNILQRFKVTLNGSNSVDIQNKSLFLYWIKLKNRSGI
ncbi:hypothetical protein ALC56_12826 [Trachymyrmex septentrionalis]|uniref:DDE-1 domain-containing protein n=1 Tax=Trachymyrmex septentrionalis TaxID=34720 RepID=A0A195EXC0_9HYME|nr:hypothetical protein ALC56_12826 [Trachymyrmex septentrionalis]